MLGAALLRQGKIENNCAEDFAERSGAKSGAQLLFKITARRFKAHCQLCRQVNFQDQIVTIMI